MLTPARSTFRPAKNDPESEKGRNDDAYDENNMSWHGTLSIQMISIVRSRAKPASTLIQINLRESGRDGMMSR
jgi:hypothetical protein